MAKRMPKPNEALKEFFKDNEAYADLFNAACFSGENVFDATELTGVDTVYENTLKLGTNYIKVKRIRDMIKKAGMGRLFSLICIEAQNKVDYTQPLRIMILDSLEYLEQIKPLLAMTEKTRWTAEEYLSNLPEGAKLAPVISVVLYTGEDPWKGPVSLHEMLEISENMKELVPDYPIKVIDLGHNKSYNFKNRELKDLNEALCQIYARESSDKEIRRSTLSLVGILAGDTKLYRLANKEGGDLRMCKVLDERDKASELRGQKRGEKRGINKINTLNRILADLGRTDDIVRAATDTKYQRKLIKELIPEMA